MADKTQKGSVFTYEDRYRLGIYIICQKEDPDPILRCYLKLELLFKWHQFLNQIKPQSDLQISQKTLDTLLARTRPIGLTNQI